MRCAFCSSVWPRNRLLQMKQRFRSSERNTLSSLDERMTLIVDVCLIVFSWGTHTPVCADEPPQKNIYCNRRTCGQGSCSLVSVSVDAHSSFSRSTSSCSYFRVMVVDWVLCFHNTSWKFMDVTQISNPLQSWIQSPLLIRPFRCLLNILLVVL